VKFGRSTAAAAPPKRDNLNGVRALIVDDNATNRQILSHQLSARGVHSSAVETGLQALAALRDQVMICPYHVAILDFQMPQMDGLMLAAGSVKIRPSATPGC
jgi:CheY-like chemotaxis protein